MRTMMSTTRTTRTMRFGGAVALGAAAALLLAACGSSGGKVSSSSPPTSASTSTSSSAPGSESAKPIAMTASTKLGQLLVDSKGMTVYTLTKDGKPVPCTGQCLTFWPPLLLPAGETSAAGAGVANLGTATTSGGKQVSYKGDPLYRFSMDKAPGDTNGEGINAFGGTWHVVKITGAPSTTPAGGVPATTPTTSMTTTSGGGNGY
jgi:predicted lipoprotein with Yx(FWY)xxD motif